MYVIEGQNARSITQPNEKNAAFSGYSRRRNALFKGQVI